jgi:hypothetical protein
LSGKRAVNVQSVLDHYDPAGNGVRMIGAKIFLLLKEKRKYARISLFGMLSCHPSQGVHLEDFSLVYIQLCPNLQVLHLI